MLGVHLDALLVAEEAVDLKDASFALHGKYGRDTMSLREERKAY